METGKGGVGGGGGEKKRGLAARTIVRSKRWSQSGPKASVMRRSLEGEGEERGRKGLSEIEERKRKKKMRTCNHKRSW